MTSYQFSRWWPRQHNTTSGFLHVDVTVFGRSKSISKPNFVDISQFMAVFEKQTSAILEFYFRFRSRPFCRNLRVILHQATEFRPNRIIHHRNIMSYRFSRWRPSAMLYLFWSNSGLPTKCLSSCELGPHIACSSD